MHYEDVAIVNMVWFGERFACRAVHHVELDDV